MVIFNFSHFIKTEFKLLRSERFESRDRHGFEEVNRLFEGHLQSF